MSGFSAEWLALREPFDRAARNAQVRDACRAAFAGRNDIAVCDIGAGTGASLRAVADLLPPRQRWTLVDDDPALLVAAGRALAAWADRSEGAGERLRLERAGKTIEVRFHRHDLAAGSTPWLAPWTAGTDLVTASAFFDLVSADWIGRLVAALADGGVALLATLSFDGTIRTEPPHPLDRAVAAAFRPHQGGDKGFGPAAGPDGWEILERALDRRGYALTSGASPWRVDRSSPPFRDALLDGIAAAAGETGLLSPGDGARWRLETGRDATLVEIGHRDLFAAPK